ncbi:hypothetical protein [Streptomyces sp. NPDC001508]
MTDTTEHTPLFDGTCVRIQTARGRYETRVTASAHRGAEGQVLAAA